MLVANSRLDEVSSVLSLVSRKTVRKCGHKALSCGTAEAKGRSRGEQTQILVSAIS